MKKVILFGLIFYSFTASSQGPWTQEKNKFYTQVSYTSIANYDTLISDPAYATSGLISDNTIQFYGAYGLSDDTSLILNLPVKLTSIDAVDLSRINCPENNCSEDLNQTALGNIEIGVKHNFYNKKWLLSGQLSAELNTSTYNTIYGLRTGYDAFTLTPLILAGRSFGKTYIQSFVGANIRSNNYSSNFKIGGEIGRKVLRSLWVIGFIDIVKSLENGTIVLPDANISTGLYVNNQEYGAFGFKIIGEINSATGVTAGFGGAFFGNNVARQAALNFGAYHKF